MVDTAGGNLVNIFLPFVPKSGGFSLLEPTKLAANELNFV